MSQPEEPVKGSTALTAAIMVAAVVVMFMAFLIVFFLYLRAKRCWGANPALGRARSRARAGLALADEAAVPGRGLDPAAIKALPSMLFRREEFKDGLECAVCLSELSEGEEARLLPVCRHGFHLECIDMWLHSHSTCPLCRCPVSSESAESGLVEAVLAAGRLPEPPIFPTNVLFWGSQDHVRGLATAAVAAGSCEGSSSSVGSSSGKPEGKLVIEIPRRVMEGCQAPVAPLRLSRLPVDEIKSPTSATLRSLKRLLSQGNRVGSSCSPRGGDIEQGVVGLELE